MGLKVDLSGMKSFFLEKGEKIGMLACLATAGVLIGYGVVHSMGARFVPGSTSTFQDAFKNREREIEGKRNLGEPLVAAVMPKLEPWPEELPTFDWKRINERSERSNNKRTNPRALAPLVDPDGNHIDMKYVRGSYFAFDINQQFKTATVIKDAKAAAPPAKGGFPFFPPAGQQPVRNQQVALQPLLTVQPLRMVVVHATFPLADQIQEFRKAFRMMNDHELFQSKDLPKFLGMNIMKAEVTPGKALNWTPLVTSSFDGTNEKVDADQALMAMLRQAIFDDSHPQYAHALIQGLAMPLPKLSILPPGNVYPKVELAGADTIEGELPEGVNPGMKFPVGGGPAGNKGLMPVMGAKAGPDAEFERIPWTKLSADLKEKFNDGFYVLSPDGIHPDPEDPKAIPGQMPIVPENRPFAVGAGGMFKGGSHFASMKFWERYPPPPVPANLVVNNEGGRPMPVPAPMGPMTNIKPYDAVIRFIDPDVKPGKTYKYSIQVRIANPNYGKKNDVAFAALADVKELKPAAPVETPTISIPDEYFLFAIDQKPDNPKVVNGSDDKDAKNDQVAVQIHRWVDVTGDRAADIEHVVGDWAIAERILLQRGDPVGRMVNVEIPVWDKKLGNYALGSSLAIEGKKAGIKLPPKGLGRPPIAKKEDKEGAAVDQAASGIPVDFADTAPPPVLIDFDGGKKTQTFPGDFRPTTDSSASSLLILRADGKLIVRNTRDDSDPAAESYINRQKRVDDWKLKVGMFRAANPNATTVPGGAPNPFFIPRKTER